MPQHRHHPSHSHWIRNRPSSSPLIGYRECTTTTQGGCPRCRLPQQRSIYDKPRVESFVLGHQPPGDRRLCRGCPDRAGLGGGGRRRRSRRVVGRGTAVRLRVESGPLVPHPGRIPGGPPRRGRFCRRPLSPSTTTSPPPLRTARTRCPGCDYFAHQSPQTGLWPNQIARDHGYRAAELLAERGEQHRVDPPRQPHHPRGPPELRGLRDPPRPRDGPGLVRDPRGDRGGCPPG